MTKQKLSLSFLQMFSLGIKQDTNLPNGDNIVVYYFSILPIKGKVFRFNLIASFPKCDPDKISFEIKKLDSIKLSKSNDILRGLLKNSMVFFEIAWLKFLMNVYKMYFLG